MSQKRRYPNAVRAGLKPAPTPEHHCPDTVGVGLKPTPTPPVSAPPDKNGQYRSSGSNAVGASFKPALTPSGPSETSRQSTPRRRNSLRLPHHDYASPGAYFVTVCTHGGRFLFGSVREETMRANALGSAVQACWHDLPEHYPQITLDAFVVMPNHVHGIFILAPESAGQYGLTEIARAFKTFSARRVNEIRHTPGQPIWQRGYHEHIIRDEASLADIREYIATNPARWAFDRENPGRFADVDAVRAGLKPAPTKGNDASPRRNTTNTVRTDLKPPRTEGDGAPPAGNAPDVVRAGFKPARTDGDHVAAPGDAGAAGNGQERRP